MVKKQENERPNINRIKEEWEKINTPLPAPLPPSHESGNLILEFILINF